VRRAVFVDRDGVLIEAVMRSGRAGSARTSAEFHIDPQSSTAVQRLSHAGFAVVVISNQPDIGRGLVSPTEIEAQNTELQRILPVDGVYLCPHDGADGCHCRKPRPGMLVDAARDLELDLSGSWMIGDRWVDLAAAQAAGVAPVLLTRPWSWEPTSAGIPPDDLRQSPSADSLEGCVDLILAASGGLDET